MVNTMLETLAEDLGFDEDVGGAVASSALFLGAICGSLFVGIFQKICGKYSQLWTGVLYGTGNLLCAVTTDAKLCWGGAFDGCVPIMILIGRLTAGTAAGLTFVIAPRCPNRFGHSVNKKKQLTADIWLKLRRHKSEEH